MSTKRTGWIQSGGIVVAALVFLIGAMPGQTQKSPATFKAAAIWKKVHMKADALDKTIQSKKLKVVHEAAFAVRDQVKLLPANSKSLSADTQAQLNKGVKTVAGLAKQLDEAGDGGKQAEAEALGKKMHTVLDAIARLYPAGALK